MAKITAVIQAGGLGTRMRDLTRDIIPKPMLEMNGKPMLQWQIENVAKYGISDFVIIVGHHGDKIKSYFGDGSDYGVNIQYITEKEPLGSAGALYYLKSNSADLFILIYGDVMFDMNVDKLVEFHYKKKALITTVCHPNSHPYDSDLIMLDSDDRVLRYFLKKEDRGDCVPNLGNAGLYIFDKKVLNNLSSVEKKDWEKDIVTSALCTERVYGYRTSEYIKDTGTPERFVKVANEQKEGLWVTRNLENKQKCIFIDRDGTINVLKGFISKPEEIELEKGVAEAIHLINESGYLAIVITNQPVVARGMCQVEDVEKIHWRLENLLGKYGAYIDDIAFCPHHPDGGYPEENPSYKIDCSCRKPKTGMIDDMIRKYNIDISKSFMIGDTTTDIQTGVNAGLKTVLVTTGEAGKDGKYEVAADYVRDNLLCAVNFILQREDC